MIALALTLTPSGIRVTSDSEIPDNALLAEDGSTPLESEDGTILESEG